MKPIEKSKKIKFLIFLIFTVIFFSCTKENTKDTENTLKKEETIPPFFIK